MTLRVLKGDRLEFIVHALATTWTLSPGAPSADQLKGEAMEHLLTTAGFPDDGVMADVDLMLSKSKQFQEAWLNAMHGFRCDAVIEALDARYARLNKYLCDAIA